MSLSRREVIPDREGDLAGFSRLAHQRKRAGRVGALWVAGYGWKKREESSSKRSLLKEALL